MSNISKFAVAGLAVALLSTAAGFANADGQEQARQLLQRSEPRTEVNALVGVVRVVAQDSHEQARRMIEGSSIAAQVNVPQSERVALIAEPDKAVDGHTKAGNLLSRSLAPKTHTTRVSRTSAVEAPSKQQPGQ